MNESNSTTTRLNRLGNFITCCGSCTFCIKPLCPDVLTSEQRNVDRFSQRMFRLNYNERASNISCSWICYLLCILVTLFVLGYYLSTMFDPKPQQVISDINPSPIINNQQTTTTTTQNTQQPQNTQNIHPQYEGTAPNQIQAPIQSNQGQAVSNQNEPVQNLPVVNQPTPNDPSILNGTFKAVSAGHPALYSMHHPDHKTKSKQIHPVITKTFDFFSNKIQEGKQQIKDLPKGLDKLTSSFSRGIDSVVKKFNNLTDIYKPNTYIRKQYSTVNVSPLDEKSKKHHLRNIF